MYRTLVFTRTKHGADRVVRHLHTRGIRAEAIHGNKSQNARQRALANFANNKIPVLIATDIASRGIDVDGITHVVNYDLTHEPETYVHRIGRTGRAGATGAAVSFCDREEVSNLRAIERLIRRPIPPATNPLPPSTGDVSKSHGHRIEHKLPALPPAPRHPTAPRSHHAPTHAAASSHHPRPQTPPRTNASTAARRQPAGRGASRSFHPFSPKAQARRH
jgi:ATP-dependent RNA helicase RhlE